jgi:hypothetical protein
MAWIERNWQEKAKADHYKMIANCKPNYRDHPCKAAVKVALIASAKRQIRKLG